MVAERAQAAPVPGFGAEPPADQAFSDEALSGRTSLSRAAGNNAMGLLMEARRTAGVPRGPHRPLPAALRREMESRFHRDFADVRLHAGPEAEALARHVNARAYTVGSHVVLGKGDSQPETATGRRLLAHELAHVIQQERGGAPAALGRESVHEIEAEAAADAATNGHVPASVEGGTAVGIARSVEDWWRETPGIQTWTYTQLLEEINELQEWMSNQIETTSDVARIEEALDMLRREAATRAEAATAPPPRPRRRRRRRERAAPAAAAPTDASGEPVEAPRILQERTSIEYRDAAEVERQVNLIMAWLQHGNLSPPDRSALQSELQSLAPAVDRSLAQRSAVRRSRRLQQALTPTVETDARDALVGQVRRVAAIRPMQGQPGLSYLMDQNEMIVITNEQADQLRSETIAALDNAARSVLVKNNAAFNRWADQAEVDRESPVASWFVSLGTGTDAVEVFDRMDPYHSAARSAYSRYQAMRRQGNLVEMAIALARAEENAIKAERIVLGWTTEVIATAEGIVAGLEITRDVSFAVALAIAAVVAAPVVAAGVAGAGLTGATATVATGLGTGALVGSGGALLGGGSAALGEAGAGSSGEDILEAAGREGARWGREGALIGVTAGITPGVSSAFGATTQGISRTSQVVRSGLAGGTINAAAEATSTAIRGGNREEIVESGLVGFGSGVFGGSAGALSQGLRRPAVRGLTEFGAGSLTAGGATLARGGTTEEAAFSAAVGGTTSLAMGRARRPTAPTRAQEGAFEAGRGVRSQVQAGVRNVRAATAAMMMGTAEPLPATRISAGSVGLPGRPSAILSQPVAPESPAQAPGATPNVSAQPEVPAQSPRTPDVEYQDFLAMIREQGGQEVRAAGEPVRMQPHARASQARRALAVTGQHESAHGLPQAVGRGVPGYSARAAITVLYRRGIHAGIDRQWKAAFQAMRRNGKTTASPREIYETVADSIRREPSLSQEVKDSLSMRLQDEMVEFGLDPSDQVTQIPLPYPNIRPTPQGG